MENKAETTIVVKQWLKDHPRLNLAGICEDAGVDKGNFNRWFKSDKSLSEKSLSSIMQQLFNYGYKWFELPAEEKAVAKTVNQPIKKETILISEEKETFENEFRPMKEGEKGIDYSLEKREWILNRKK